MPGNVLAPFHTGIFVDQDARSGFRGAILLTFVAGCASFGMNSHMFTGGNAADSGENSRP